jgi:hypothetical protein
MKKVIGLDFGNTLTYRLSKHGESQRVAFPDAIRVTRQLCKLYPVYIISKVNDQQKIDVTTWLKENDFFNQVGMPPGNLHFCAERWQKNGICVDLGVTHHFDDRPEVIAHLNPSIKGFLFRPKPEEVVEYFASLHCRDSSIVHTWREIEKILIT